MTIGKLASKDAKTFTFKNFIITNFAALRLCVKITARKDAEPQSIKCILPLLRHSL